MYRSSLSNAIVSGTWAEAQGPQHSPDPGQAVLDPVLLANHLRHALEGPQVGGVAVGARAPLQEGEQRLLLPRGDPLLRAGVLVLPPGVRAFGGPPGLPPPDGHVGYAELAGDGRLGDPLLEHPEGDPSTFLASRHRSAAPSTPGQQGPYGVPGYYIIDSKSNNDLRPLVLV
jgi:hypothetical protein